MSCWHVCTSWCDGHYNVKCKCKSTIYEVLYYAVFYRFQVFSVLIQRSRLGNMCAPDSNTLLNPWYTQWMFNAYELLFYAVPHFNRYTLILQYIRLYFVLKQVFELLFLGYTGQNTPLPSLFFLRPIPYSIPSFIDVTALWCFLKRYYNHTSNWLSLLLTDHVDGVRLRLWTAATNGPIAHPPGDIWARITTMEWCRQGKTPDSSIRALWQSCQQSHLAAKVGGTWGEGHDGFCLWNIYFILCRVV
jgi:hypothetical protein